MDSTTIIVLAALVYGAFLGYCLGRYQGYKNGADIVREFYRK
jgi:membrane protein DedA with SNARE-associated domain